MNKQFKRYLQGSLIFLDLLILVVIFWILRRFFNDRIPIEYNYSYFYFWIYSIIVWILVSFFTGNYTEKVILHFESFTQRTVQVYILSMVLLLIYLFFLREINISRLFIGLYVLMFGIGLTINRFLYVGIRNYIKNKETLFNKVVILGYNETALKLSSYFEQESINTQLLGFIDDEKNIRELTHYPILSDVKNVIQVAKDMDVQEIYSTITPEQNSFIYDLMAQAEKECIRFKVVPNLAYFFSRPVVVDYLRDLPILSLRSEPLEDVGNQFKKRFLDLTVSLLVTVFVLSWMIPIIGLLIFIESRGPIFFKQTRTGKNNQPFACLKFRSMRPNREADLLQATKHDQRITRIGRFLRKTSLDEFPQFINVLRGEMSLVGPRPHMVKHTDDYSKVVEQYMIRHFIKPGITGWAQVNGFRGEITEPKQIKLRVQNDLWYLENWNIWLDIRIMFMTVYTIIRGDKNAY
jgi:putative colanic acid biosynthesis UDP-glucose lipid carrier transferase